MTADQKLSGQVGQAWITLGVDVEQKSFLLVGFAESKAECATHKNRTDYPNVQSFRFDVTLRTDVSKWLSELGVPSQDISPILRLFSEELKRISSSES